MALNHVRPHKYIKRQALGAYRIFACVCMVGILAFLVVYETWVSVALPKQRVYMTPVFWLCLLTLLFFTMTITHYKKYDFGSQAGRPPLSANDHNQLQSSADGPHPFYDWKIITHLFAFCLQASIHLVILTFYQDSVDVQTFDLVAPLITLAPLFFLAIDWVANRIYIPLVVSLQYSLLVYSLAVLAMAVRRDIV